MSLINQMFKSLAQSRNKKYGDQSQNTAGNPMTHPEGQTTSTMLVPLLSFWCLISTGGLGYLLLKQMNVVEQQLNTQLVPKSNAKPNSVAIELKETKKTSASRQPDVIPTQTLQPVEPKKPRTSLSKTHHQPKLEQIDHEKIVNIEAITLSSIELSEQYHSKGKLAEQQGSIATALEAYHRSLRLNDKAHRTREAIVTLLLSEKKYNQAIFHLTEGMQKYPEHEDYTLLLIKLYEHLDRPKDALDLLLSFTPSTKNKLFLLQTQVKLAHKLGDFDLTEQAYRDLVQLQPDNAKWWFGLGHALDNQSKTELAISIYEHTLEMNTLPNKTAQYTGKRLKDLRGY